MSRSWEKLSPEVTILFNPAFTSLLICTGILEYNQGKKSEAPFIFPFLLLPLILHPPTRRNLPSTSRSTFTAWITKEDNASIKLGFANRAKSMTPFVKDALLFAMKNRRLNINPNGMIEVTSIIKFSETNSTDEVIECVRKAKFCGKWFSKIGSLDTAMALLGVQP